MGRPSVINATTSMRAEATTNALDVATSILSRPARRTIRPLKIAPIASPTAMAPKMIGNQSPRPNTVSNRFSDDAR